MIELGFWVAFWLFAIPIGLCLTLCMLGGFFRAIGELLSPPNPNAGRLPSHVDTRFWSKRDRLEWERKYGKPGGWWEDELRQIAEGRAALLARREAVWFAAGRAVRRARQLIRGRA